MAREQSDRIPLTRRAATGTRDLLKTQPVRTTLAAAPTGAVLGGIALDFGGIASGHPAVTDAGLAVVWAGLGLNSAQSSRPLPSARNPIGIQSRRLRRVMIAGGALGVAAGFAAAGAGVHGEAVPVAIATGALANLAGIVTGL